MFAKFMIVVIIVIVYSIISKLINTKDENNESTHQNAETKKENEDDEIYVNEENYKAYTEYYESIMQRSPDYAKKVLGDAKKMEEELYIIRQRNIQIIEKNSKDHIKLKEEFELLVKDLLSMKSEHKKIVENFVNSAEKCNFKSMNDEIFSLIQNILTYNKDNINVLLESNKENIKRVEEIINSKNNN